jgi:membrane-associated phospholipid phosphatase
MIDNIQEVVDSFIENPLLGIGYYGPIIMIFINIYFLCNRLFWCLVYVCFILVNIALNKGLKTWIKEPRPINWKAFISFEKLEKEESYGMPSGHAQSVGFSLIFYYLLFGIDEIFYIMICITTLTIYQRYINKNHTLVQLFVGLIIGGIFSYGVFYFTKKYKNKIYLWNI